MSVIIDARSAAESAIKKLLKKKKQLELPDLQIQPLKDFLQEAEQHKLTKRDKQLICDQAILIMEQFYAHLPFKRARYAADPAVTGPSMSARIARVRCRSWSPCSTVSS